MLVPQQSSHSSIGIITSWPFPKSYVSYVPPTVVVRHDPTVTLRSWGSDLPTPGALLRLLVSRDLTCVSMISCVGVAIFGKNPLLFYLPLLTVVIHTLVVFPGAVVRVAHAGTCAARSAV